MRLEAEGKKSMASAEAARANLARIRHSDALARTKARGEVGLMTRSQESLKEELARSKTQLQSELDRVWQINHRPFAEREDVQRKS